MSRPLCTTSQVQSLWLLPCDRYSQRHTGMQIRSGQKNFRDTTRIPLQMKRVYDGPSDTDGTRILIDRLWPRGLTKAQAKVDLWLKAIAPSTALRQWFGHDPRKWEEFKQRYQDEL